MKFATKPVRHYPPNFRHVATLPWEIKYSNLLQMWKKTQKILLIASNFVINPQILIFCVCFQCLIIASLSMDDSKNRLNCINCCALCIDENVDNAALLNSNIAYTIRQKEETTFF